MDVIQVQKTCQNMKAKYLMDNAGALPHTHTLLPFGPNLGYFDL